jgi:hypothetical protein
MDFDIKTVQQMALDTKRALEIYHCEETKREDFLNEFNKKNKTNYRLDQLLPILGVGV